MRLSTFSLFIHNCCFCFAVALILFLPARSLAAELIIVADDNDNKDNIGVDVDIVPAIAVDIDVVKLRKDRGDDTFAMRLLLYITRDVQFLDQLSDTYL